MINGFHSCKNNKLLKKIVKLYHLYGAQTKGDKIIQVKTLTCLALELFLRNCYDGITYLSYCIMQKTSLFPSYDASYRCGNRFIINLLFMMLMLLFWNFLTTFLLLYHRTEAEKGVIVTNHSLSVGTIVPYLAVLFFVTFKLLLFNLSSPLLINKLKFCAI